MSPDGTPLNMLSWLKKLFLWLIHCCISNYTAIAPALYCLT